MPTARPRHAVTETDEVARAIDAAAHVWPELRRDRAALLRRLIERGAESVRMSEVERRAHRLEAIRAASGSLTGVYRPNEAQLLREEWPE